MIKLRAAARLLKADARPLADPEARQLKAQQLFLRLKKRRVPAVLNHMDYSIGCTIEFWGLLQALELLGWAYESVPEPGTNDVTMRDGSDIIRISEARPGWNPMIQILH